MARLPLLEIENMPEKTREMISGGKSDMKGLNINRMVAHAEKSARHFMRLGNSLLTQAKLDSRLRELCILRIATLCESRYEWHQHEILARKIGIPEEQIAAVKLGSDRPEFSELEQMVLKYTEEVTVKVKSSDETFNYLNQKLSHQELVELTLTIGFYNLVARLLENTEVEIES